MSAVWPLANRQIQARTHPSSNFLLSSPLAFILTRRITPMRLRSWRHGHEGIIADIVVTQQEATSDEGEGGAKGAKGEA